MNLPTQQQCLDYFTKYKVPENIFHHCQRVQKVSVVLAEKLQQKVPVNIELVRCLGILHDLFKMITIKEFGKNHYHKEAVITAEQQQFWTEMQQTYPDLYEGDVAYIIFKDEFPELAVALENVSNPRHENYTWEERIVHYADWRVLQEKIVLLEERLAYLRERYPRPSEVWERYAQKIKKMEQTIFLHLSFPPEQLEQQVDHGN